MQICEHVDLIQPVVPSSWGCTDCLAAGHRDWVHLRLCMTCGHAGCCDRSPRRHARAHFRLTRQPIIAPCEPGESWFYCNADDLLFVVEGAPPSLSHP